LENSTEIVLELLMHRARPAPSADGPPGRRRWRRRRRTGRTRRAAAAGALRIGRTFGAALTTRRALGVAEAGALFWSVALLVALGVVGLMWPEWLAYPIAVLCLWIAVSLTLQAVGLLRARSRRAERAQQADRRAA